MLIIRDAQFRAFQDTSIRDLGEEIVGLLQRKYPRETQGLALGYLEDLSRLSIDFCLKHGFDRMGTIVEFAEALIRNDVHPLDSAKLAHKAQIVLSELRSRQLFMTLQSLNLASTNGNPDAANGVQRAQE